MPSRSVLSCAVVSLALAGCLFQNLSPTQGLSDQVYALNDESRWDRLDLAVQRVAPRYRATFMGSRHAWGDDIAIADTEVSALVVADDLASATSSVEISWVDQRSMTLRSTVLRQRWIRTDNGYLLEEETVTSGDESLLSEPDEGASDDESVEARSSISPSRG